MASNCLTNHHRPNVRQMARPTTNGSSAWKEALKRSCLERARQKRRSAITRARLQILSDSELGTTFHDNNNTGGNHGPDNIMHQEDQGPDFEIDMEETAYKRKSQKRDFLGSATEVIEHELKASGVGVGTASPHFILSPEPSQIMAETETYKKSRTWSVAKEQKVRSSFSSEYSEDVRSLGTSMAAVDPLDNDGLNDESCNENLETISNQQKQNMEWHEKSGGDVDLFDDGYDSTEEEYVISEEEYYDLMREVEEELHREESLMAEEILEIERCERAEQELIEEQISDFEHMENVYDRKLSHRDDEDGIAPVVCPICTKGYLLQTASNVIICPNAASKYPFSSAAIESTTRLGGIYCNFRLDVSDEGLTLNHLREQLRVAYDEHNGACQTGNLKFCIRDQFGIFTLAATCAQCDLDVVIL